MTAISERRGKWHINLPLCNKMQLMSMGVTTDHIGLSDICTYKAHDTFFSARRLGIHSGRIYTGIMTKQPSCQQSPDIV
jgi:copper oxidase (laccase) domain-containing protein